MAFTRKDLREILGDAYTDEIGKKIVDLHLSVLDPLKDDLDTEKKTTAKLQKEADKVPDLEAKVAEYSKDDYKAKYEKEHSDFEAYKGQVTKDAETAKVKAAYRKLLTEEKISEKTLDAVLNATDYSSMKLKEDGSLDGIEDLKKDIDTKWGSFKVTTRKRGEPVDNHPSGGEGGPDGSVREMIAGLHARKYGAPQGGTK